MPNQSKEHSKLVHAIRLELGGRGDCVLWLNSKVEFVNGQPRAKPGLAVGASDLIGIAPGGKFLALEVKTGDARPTPKQKMFLELVNARGGVGRVVRSVEEATAAMEEART